MYLHVCPQPNIICYLTIFLQIFAHLCNCCIGQLILVLQVRFPCHVNDLNVLYLYLSPTILKYIAHRCFTITTVSRVVQLPYTIGHTYLCLIFYTCSLHTYRHMAANIKCIIRVNVTTQFILTGYVIIQLYVCFVKILFYFRLQKHVAISKRSQYVPF